MITASGAEGISLTNVRYVHIVEPYWHPVRREQVIGRARRICSHSTLPPDLQTVQVFLYLSVFSQKQLDDKNKGMIQINLKDRSKIDPSRVLTTDEYLHEISNIKEQLTNQLLEAIQKTAIDCKFHNKDAQFCYTFTGNNKEKHLYLPDINDDETDEMLAKNRKQVEFKAKQFAHPTTKEKYVLNVNTNLFYSAKDYQDWKQSKGPLPDPIGEIQYINSDNPGAKQQAKFIMF